MGELVKGNVSSGYERVRDLYEEDLARGSDVDSQLCVYVAGERVIDLWGSHGPKRDPNYGPDSIQVRFHIQSDQSGWLQHPIDLVP